MPDKAFIGFRDYSDEIGTAQFNTLKLTAGNLAAQQALFVTLQGAVDAITRGALADLALQVITPGSSILPTDEEAQVEKTWLILYADNQTFLDPGTDLVPNPGFGKIFQANWPTALYDTHLLPSSDFADLAETDVAAFVAAFEDLIISPYGGTVTVLSMQVAGARR